MWKIEVNYKRLSPSAADVAFDVAEYAHPQTVEGCWAKLESLREGEQITTETYDKIKEAVTFSMRPVTRMIAGQEVTLVPGLRYLASRPTADRFRKEFPIRIQKLTGTTQRLLSQDYEEIIEGLSYDEANKFLSAFNNGGATSFDGRVW